VPACKDCGSTTRKLTAPGPRCTTCKRARRNAGRDKAHAARVLSVYGITGEQYWALYEAQGGKCALCQRATGKTKRLAVDHDHSSGLPRGLLDGTCNKILGHFRDDPAAFQRCIDYLATPPAQQLFPGLQPVPGHIPKDANVQPAA
jgi:hypothetical protein